MSVKGYCRNSTFRQVPAMCRKHHESVCPGRRIQGERSSISVKLARIPTAPTAITCGEEKVPQNGSFPGGRSAGGIVSTVANLLSAGDSRMDYRPQENPANHYIHGDAGGILLDVTYARRSYFEPRPRCPYFDYGPSKPSRTPLERVMNSIRNRIGMRETEIAKKPSRPWNPHSYAVFAQVHNTL